MIITLDRRHPEFKSYMRGTFSQAQRALPVRSFDVESHRESVTFAIKPLQSCLTVSWWRAWLVALRPWTLLFALAPILLTANLLTEHGLWRNFRQYFLCSLSVLWLLIAANLLNDYLDHIKGVDRVESSGGSRVIQRGWIAAHQMQKAAFCFFALSVLSALPTLLEFTPLVIVIAVLTATLIILYLVVKESFGYRVMGETILFLLFGPLCTTSLGFVGSGKWLTALAWLGVWTGASAAQIYFLRACENALVDARSHQFTLAARAGFDRALRVLVVFCLVRMLGLLALAYTMPAQSWLYLIWLLVEMGLQIFLLKRAGQTPSPLSSNLSSLRTFAWRSYRVLVALAACALWLQGL